MLTLSRRGSGLDGDGAGHVGMQVVPLRVVLLDHTAACSQLAAPVAGFGCCRVKEKEEEQILEERLKESAEGSLDLLKEPLESF